MELIRLSFLVSFVAKINQSSFENGNLHLGQKHMYEGRLFVSYG